MSWLNSGLFRRFALLLGVLSLAPVLFLGAWLFNLSRRGIEDSVLELQMKLAERFSEGIQDYVGAIDSRARFLLDSLTLPLPWSDKESLMKRFITASPDVADISILDKDGKPIVKAYNPDFLGGARLDLTGGDAAFRTALSSGRRIVDVRLVAGGPRGTFPVILLYYPLSAARKGPARAARLAVSLGPLSRRIRAERVGGTGFAVLAGPDGEPLLYPREKLGPEELASFPRWPIVKAALEAGSVGSSLFTPPGGHEFVGAYAPVPVIGGAIFILQAGQEALRASAQARRGTLWALGVVLVVALLGGALIARYFSLPLVSLARAAERVSQGDFGTKVSIKTHDELAELAATFNSMTERLGAYAELQIDRLLAEQRKTQAILFSINDGIVMADTGGKILLTNRRALELLRLEPERALGGSDLRDIGLPPLLASSIKEVLEKPGQASFRFVELSEGEERRHLRVAARPVVTPEKKEVLGTVVSLRDVTAERELDRMKDEFFHYVTHDLRNPLSSAMGFLDMLLRGGAGELTAEQGSIVTAVKRSATRLLGMVNNILDIAKMEAGKIKVNLQEVSLEEAARRARAELETLAARKSIEVEVAGAPGAALRADPDMIERIFINLLGNAIKFTPEKGRVKIAVEDAGTSLRASVEDSGEGLPPELLGRLFGKFEQADGHKKGGTGLGLAIVKFFVEAHRGRVWAESEPGRGARFLFEIPKNLCLDKSGRVALPSQTEAA